MDNEPQSADDKPTEENLNDQQELSNDTNDEPTVTESGVEQESEQVVSTEQKTEENVAEETNRNEEENETIVQDEGQEQVETSFKNSINQEETVENEDTKPEGTSSPKEQNVDSSVEKENNEDQSEPPSVEKTAAYVEQTAGGVEQTTADVEQTTADVEATGDANVTEENQVNKNITGTEQTAEIDPDAMDEKVMESAIKNLETEPPQLPPVPLPSQGIPTPSAEEASPTRSYGASAVEQATPADVIASYRDEQTQPLSLEWTFGFNRHVGCVNLSDSMRNLVLYAASHLVVMYDYKNNAQKLLQGHANAVTCISASEDKRWVVSVDKGKDSTVIVWDTYTGIPVQTIFKVHNDQGCTAVTMSPDAKYIATVSTESPQVVSVWDWTNSVAEPVCSAELKYTYGVQNYIKFHPTNNNLLVSNSESQVVFYNWSEDSLKFHAPTLSDDIFNRVVGQYSQSIFQLDSGNRALTATSVGNIVVWEPERQIGKTGTVSLYKKKALKLVRMQDRSLTTLTQTDTYVVTGDVMGQVKFYDQSLNMINWYQGLNVGPINSLSFKYEPEVNMDKLTENSEFPDDATIPANRFVVNDFLVSTRNAEITKVETEGSQYIKILQEHDASVHALAACPSKPVICIGSYAGLIKLWDYEKKSCIVTRVFEKGMHVQCVAFSPNGLEIAVGMTNGSVYIFDAIALEDELQHPFRYARDAITKCVFSHNSRYLATSDADKATTVFVFKPESGWNYLGRYRAHYKDIQDIAFGVALDSDAPKLLTLGKDRVLVEYDLENSSKDDLRLLSVDRLEQSAIPNCLVWYPPVTKESFLVTCNNQYKFRLYNTTTKMCRRTLLAPTYGSPIKKMAVVPIETQGEPEKRILAYITDHKVGLQMLPLDGNPHRSVATVAHPNGVSHLSCSCDGKYIFTAGGKDSAVHMWAISHTSLQAAASLGGEDLVPFYGLLEGGRNGELFAELENYFYYAQLRSQGLGTKERRAASTTIDIEQVPFVMRALGFYPPEQEIEDMLNEIKFSKYVDTGEYVDEIDLGDFIKLYVNHRPAFGLTLEDLQQAFTVLGKSLSKDGEIDRMELLNILQRKGEHMTEQELAENLATLLGYVPEGGSTAPRKNYFVGDVANDFLNTALPEQITANMFSEEVLGLPVYDE